MYMAMLAAAIAGERLVAGEQTAPVTDSPRLLSYLGPPDGSPEDVFNRLRCETVALLPVPGGAVTAAALADFKRDHGEQLEHLRDYLDSRIIAAAQSTDGALRARQVEIWTRQIRREIKEVNKAMQARRWPQVVLLGVGGLAAVGLGVAWALVTAGASTLLLGLAIGQGLASGGGAVYTAADLLERGGIDESKPLAYAAQVSALGRPTPAWRRVLHRQR
jgi:hypothetical protein